MWRRACVGQVLPLEERLGWDGVDELKAATLGWRTRSLRKPVFYHHRAFAARERGARWRAWAATGETAHYLGSRTSYVFLRTFHHARRERAALGLFLGYAPPAARAGARPAGETLPARPPRPPRPPHPPRRGPAP